MGIRSPVHPFPDIHHMTTSRPLPSASRGRFNILNTLEKPAANLDAKSLVALEWIKFWIHRHESQSPAPAVVIRLALQVLAQHLSSVEPNEVRGLVNRFREAAKGSGGAISLTQARARIEEHLRAPGAQPMDHWEDALYSAEELKDRADIVSRLEAHMASAFPHG